MGWQRPFGESAGDRGGISEEDRWHLRAGRPGTPASAHGARIPYQLKMDIGKIPSEISLASVQVPKQPLEVLGNLLLRLRTGGLVAAYPNTSSPLRLANHLAGLISLLHKQPALIPLICYLRF